MYKNICFLLVPRCPASQYDVGDPVVTFAVTFSTHIAIDRLTKCFNSNNFIRHEMAAGRRNSSKICRNEENNNNNNNNNNIK